MAARSGTIARLGALLACLLAGGCARPRPARLFHADQPLSQGQYPAVLRTWTRSARLYRHLENKLFFTATFHAPELRRAFAMTFPDLYGHGSKITRRELVEFSGAGDQAHTFFVAAFTPELGWNDFERADSIWHMTLTGGQGVAVASSEVIPVKVDANIQAVYPYISPFDRIYLVRFPLFDSRHRLVADTTCERLTLRIASALGVAQMHWDLDIGGPKPAPTPHPPWLGSDEVAPF